MISTYAVCEEMEPAAGQVGGYCGGFSGLVGFGNYTSVQLSVPCTEVQAYTVQYVTQKWKVKLVL